MAADPVARRVEVAERIASVIAPLTGVSCIFVIGSVATGLADEHSDVDLTVASSSAIPTRAQRRRLLHPLGRGWTFNDPPVDNPIWEEVDRCPSVDGVPIEICHQRAALITSVLDQVIRRGALTTSEVPFRPYTVAGMIRTAKVLHDPDGTFRDWRLRTNRYSRRLKRNIVAHFLPLMEGTADELRSHAERGLGPSAYLHLLNRSADAMRTVLYAVNEVYDPADRRADSWLLSMLSTAPARFSERYAEVIAGPFTGAKGVRRAKQWQRLVGEVARLCEPGRRPIRPTERPALARRHTGCEPVSRRNSRHPTVTRAGTGR